MNDILIAPTSSDLTNKKPMKKPLSSYLKDKKEKQLILRLIDLVAVIANEQATREFSGTKWGKETTFELAEIYKAYKELR